MAIGMTQQAHAISFDRIGDLSEIVQTSTLAFRGKVTKIQYFNVDTGARRPVPVTEISFLVQEGYWGTETGRHITLRQIGGKSTSEPNLEMVVPGLPQFELGVHYAVFANDQEHPVIGAQWGNHGVFRIAAESNFGQRIFDRAQRPLIKSHNAIPAASRHLHCAQFSRQTNTCTQLVSHTDDTSIDDGAPQHDLPTQQLLSLADFDRYVQGLTQIRSQAEQAQTVTASRHQFKEAVKNFFARN